MTIRDILITFSIEPDKDAEAKVNNAIKAIKTKATDALSSIGVGFQTDPQSEQAVQDSVNSLKENAEQLADNKVAYVVDKPSEKAAENSMKDLNKKATKLLGALGIGFSLVKVIGMAKKFITTNENMKGAVEKVKSEWNNWKKEIDDTYGISKRLAQIVIRGMNQIMKVVRRATEGFMRFANKIGGVDKLLKLLAISAGAILVALNAGKILTFIKGLGTAMGKANAKMLALVAVIVIIALLIEDLVHFMKGEDSLIGSLLGEEEAEALREAINGIIETAKSLLPVLMDVGKTLGGVLMNAVKMLVPLLLKLVPVIVKILDVALKLIGKVLTVIGNLISDLMPVIEEIIDTAIDLIDEVLTVIIDLIDELIPVIEEIIDVTMDMIRQVLPVIIDLIKQLLPFIMQIIKQVLPIILNLIKQLLPLFMRVITAVLPVIISLIEKLLPVVMEIIEKVLPVLMTLLEKWLTIVAQVYDKVLPIIIDLIEKLLPIIMQIIDAVLPVVISLIETLMDAILPIIDAVLPVLMDLLDALMPVITFVAELLGNVLGAAFESLGPIIDGVTALFSGLIDFISGVFSGDWSKAWEGVKSIFKGIVDTLLAIFKAPINGIVTAINTVIGGLNKLTIPDWVPLIGGKGVNISLIPTLAKGGVLPKGQTGFLEGDGAEAVVPLEKNTGWVSKVAALFTAELGGDGSIASMFGDIAQTLRDVAKLGAAPRPETLAAASGNTDNRSIVQYNEFTNQFNGDRAGQQKSAEAMDRAAYDATDVLARGLAYAR